MSDYRHGDVFQDIVYREANEVASSEQTKCDVGLATVAALYRMVPSETVQLSIRIPRDDPQTSSRGVHRRSGAAPSSDAWQRLTEQSCELQCPDLRFNYLFDAAVRSLLLHTSVDVYPGPYTYRRFWFRDAAFILNALLALGFTDRVKGLLDLFPTRQARSGYFRSQEGEWDSNGEVIWLIDRFRQISGQRLSDELIEAVRKGARWIVGKRLDPDLKTPYAGLMPAGFSAEHLGPNDNYYWDDFWSAAGLRSAARIFDEVDEHQTAHEYLDEADSLMRSVDRSIVQTALRRDRLGVPASPHRRMDSGAVGSLAAGYPLQLWDADDRRLLDTANFLWTHCLVDGGFFQDMIHSGINAYLTLHLAQVLLRSGDVRHAELTQAVADLASPTGQWPEAIHPRTGGGCMGDGHHVWASAEWVMMIRNCFVREEGQRLVLCSGIPDHWLETSQTIRFGPTSTPYGPITVYVTPHEETQVSWTAEWRGAAPPIEVVEGYRVCPQQIHEGEHHDACEGSRP
jgi:hypothetical protein